MLCFLPKSGHISRFLQRSHQFLKSRSRSFINVVGIRIDTNLLTCTVTGRIIHHQNVHRNLYFSHVDTPILLSLRNVMPLHFIILLMLHRNSALRIPLFAVLFIHSTHRFRSDCAFCFIQKAQLIDCVLNFKLKHIRCDLVDL